MSTTHGGLKSFGPDHEKIVLIFIHDFELWTKSYISTIAFRQMEVYWKITSIIRTFNSINYNRTRYYYEPIILNLIVFCILIPSQILNNLTSVLSKILMVGTLNSKLGNTDI
ncbi:hypothetical protein H8356DRAFT_1418551 [Neocallimastix lanati (nom. inval.)]|nr:hypothetical protein H8356DRAFT_1418551 [Neocallimastix sp. JGI-2020a]